MMMNHPPLHYYSVSHCSFQSNVYRIVLDRWVFEDGRKLGRGGDEENQHLLKYGYQGEVERENGNENARAWSEESRPGSVIVIVIVSSIGVALIGIAVRLTCAVQVRRMGSAAVLGWMMLIGVGVVVWCECHCPHCCYFVCGVCFGVGGTGIGIDSRRSRRGVSDDEQRRVKRRGMRRSVSGVYGVASGVHWPVMAMAMAIGRVMGIASVSDDEKT